MSNPYEILGVGEQASDEEVKKGIPKIEPQVSSGRQRQFSERCGIRRKIQAGTTGISTDYGGTP